MDTALSHREERWGLAIALGLHLLLMAALLIQPARREVLDIPERMTVSLAEDVGLEATAPDPVAESRAAVAPELADQPQPAPDQAKPAVTSKPSDAITSAKAKNTQPAPKPTAKPKGGSEIGSNFLEGAGSSKATEDTRIPASQIGRSAKASIIQAIVRQIRPHWNAPSGIDAELLVTELAFELDEDGRLMGRPRVINQSGITDSNRPQASLHAERAIRAVQLAAPFDLPDEYYNAWKSIRGARFDRNLSR
ncbi:MAG: energy transducer TonB [Alphaproteobacteria bacterium]|nr:MAG: energy transducer TonB [Alphaproteobacteria bacterium]